MVTHMFSSVPDLFASVSAISEMLQVFYLDVTKVDMMLHMLQCDSTATSVYCSCGALCMRMGSGGVATGAQAIPACAWELGERRIREARGPAGRRGVREARKHGGAAWAVPSYTCSRHWHGCAAGVAVRTRASVPTYKH
jgi:hypothetical protein